MSIIFEGDTTQRFGDKFPRTFIERITLKPSSRIEVDVSVFFEAPTQEDEFDLFKDGLTDSGLTIHAYMVTPDAIQQVKESSDLLILNNFFSLSGSSGNLEKAIDEFELIDEEIYNSEGKRFIHYKHTFNFIDSFPDYSDTSVSQARTVATFSTFLNFTATDNSKDIVFYKQQTGDLTYENIFKPNGEVNRDVIQTFE